MSWQDADKESIVAKEINVNAQRILQEQQLARVLITVSMASTCKLKRLHSTTAVHRSHKECIKNILERSSYHLGPIC